MVNLNELLHTLGISFVKFAFPMLIQSSILMAILLVLTCVLRTKLKAIFLYGLWMLLLVKLVLPASLTTPFSMGGLWGDHFKETLTNIGFSSNTSQEKPSSLPNSKPLESTQKPKPTAQPSTLNNTPATTAMAPSHDIHTTSIAWQEIVFLIWLATVLAMTLLLLQRALFVKGLVAQASEPQSHTRDLLADCCKKMGMKQNIGLWLSPNTTSPAVCGLFRPVVLLPQHLEEAVDASQLKMVLMHELAHVQRGDLWVNLVQTLLQIVYFYNPLLWLANAVIRRIREQAVDETVMVAMREKADAYPETLLQVAKLAFGRPSLGLRLVGVVENKSAFKGRMKHMLNRPVPQNAKIGSLGMLTVLAIGSFVLPMASAINETKEPPTDDSKSIKLSNANNSQITERGTETDELAYGNGSRTGPLSKAGVASLQERINAARPGNTVIIPAGIYTEPLTIDKSLLLKGQSAGDCVFQVTANQPAVLADSKGKGTIILENITIKWQLATSDKEIENPCAILFKDTRGKASHCTVTALGNPMRSPNGLRVQGFSNVTIDDCSFQGFEYVVQFMAGTKGVLQDSFIKDCGHQGVINYAHSTMRILRNIITGSKYHAVRSTGGTLYVEDNLLIDNQGSGIYLGNKTCQGVIRNNAIIRSGTGITGFANARVRIENNLFMNSSYADIGSRSSCRLTIKNNIITDSPRGIIVFPEKGNTRHHLRIGPNAYWNNETNTENCEIAAGSIMQAPQFTDVNNGDFSLQTVLPDKPQQGLQHPEIIKSLWDEWTHTQQ